MKLFEERGIASMAQLGLQLYSLREMANEDFIGTLKKVSEIGYQGVEFAGYGGLSAPELRGVLDGLGLKPVSSHVQLSLLESNLDEVLTYAEELGMKHIVCPVLREDMRKDLADYVKVAESLNKIGEAAHNRGLHFAYHNHAFEFTKFDDVYALDVLYANTDPRFVEAELDVYWVEYAGESATKYIEKYANRSSLIHIKDMTKDEERFFAEVGTGQLDIAGILSASEKAGIEWFIVEQDASRRDPLESVTMSYRYMTQSR